MIRRPLVAFFFALFVLLLVGYGLFEGRRLIEGPNITVGSPLDGSATSSMAVLVSGEAQNIAFLSINDKQQFIDKTGHFEELLSLPPGFTIVTVAAQDRFGRKTSRSVSFTVLNYCINA